MMTSHWVLCNVGSPDRIQELSYAIQECGRTVDILSLKDTYKLTESIDETPSLTIFRGSLNLSNYLKKSRPNWKGLLHNREDYLCSRYYSYWGDYIVQCDHIMLTHAEILRRWDSVFDEFGTSGKLFIRPNSGEKEFTGSVVYKKNKDAWASETGNLLSVKPEELCILSKPLTLENEIRLIIANKKVITGSVYREFGTILHIPIEDQPDYNEILKFAEERLEELDFPIVHCLDLAKVNGEYKVLEVGCFCCCGLYQCDLHKIARQVSWALEHESK